MLRSAVITLAIAALIALCFSNFWLAFPIAIVCQIIAYNTFMYVYNAWILLENKKLENERLSIYNEQSVEVTCPCQERVPAQVPIDLNGENSYQCPKCDRSCAILLEYETVLKTTPVDNVTKNVNQQLSLGIDDNEQDDRRAS